VTALGEKLGEAGVAPNDILVFFLETDRASGSFGGGQFGPPVAFALSMNTRRRSFHRGGRVSPSIRRSP
jgi:hypothetical protein